MSRIFQIVENVMLEGLIECEPIDNDVISEAIDLLENKISPDIEKALTHSPDSNEICRFTNQYQCSDVAGIQNEVRDYVEKLNDINFPPDFARLSKSVHIQWAKKRNILAKHMLDGDFLHFVADVFELFEHKNNSKRMRAVAMSTGVQKPRYTYHDSDYIDTIEISDDESYG